MLGPEVGNCPTNAPRLGSVCKLNESALRSVRVEAIQGLVDDGDQPQGDIVDGELLVACAKGAILLVPVDNPLNDVPLAICLFVEVLLPPLVAASRNHGL